MFVFALRQIQAGSHLQGMENERVRILNNFLESSLFGHLNPKDSCDLIDTAATHRYQSGETIVHAGEIWPHLFWIRSGEVVAVKESFEGRSLLLTTLHAGEVFWGLAFFIEQAPMPASLRVTRDTQILLWSLEDLKPLFLKDGRLGWELSRLMIQRVQLASEIVEKLAFQPVGGRLASLLVEFAGVPSGQPIARDLTLDEMAARIGSTREVVCRFLHRFSDQGLIEITRSEFSIKDRTALEKLAGQVKG